MVPENTASSISQARTTMRPRGSEFAIIRGVSLRVETFRVGPLDNNLYLLIDDHNHEAVVVDPSIESAPALQRMRELLRSGVHFSGIWNTHGHFDHIYDNALWKAELAAPILMHRDDDFFVQRLREQALWMGLPPPTTVSPDHWLNGGETLKVGGYHAAVLLTPGHSPGSVTFYFAGDGLCISGDVLFQGSVGRTDLPGCSVEQLQHSLATLLQLPDATRVLPGHGEPTTIGLERRTNPFCQSLPPTNQETELR